MEASWQGCVISFRIQGRMHVGPWGLELGRAQYTLLPGSIDQQQACARGTLLASEERGAGLRCTLALFL